MSSIPTCISFSVPTPNSTNYKYQFCIIVLVCENVIGHSHGCVLCANKLNVESN